MLSHRKTHRQFLTPLLIRASRPNTKARASKAKIWEGCCQAPWPWTTQGCSMSIPTASPFSLKGSSSNPSAYCQNSCARFSGKKSLNSESSKSAEKLSTKASAAPRAPTEWPRRKRASSGKRPMMAARLGSISARQTPHPVREASVATIVPDQGVTHGLRRSGRSPRKERSSRRTLGHQGDRRSWYFCAKA